MPPTVSPASRIRGCRGWSARSSPGSPIIPDADQREVIDHRDGPLLVLAGPGTGKTATVVELVADRVERDGLRPEKCWF